LIKKFIESHNKIQVLLNLGFAVEFNTSFG